MSLLTKAGIRKLSQLEIDVNKDWQGKRITNVKFSIVEPTSGNTGAKNWQSEGPLEVCTIGADGESYRVQSLVLGTEELSGSLITITLDMKVGGIVDNVYNQSFNRSPGHYPPGLWIINGTLGIHEALVVKLESNSPSDDGKVISYDYSLEPA